ncbi:MAG: flagellar basal-body MS-ring/collar protein FliF [Rhodoferax sp.]
MQAVATLSESPSLVQRVAALDRGQRMRLALGVVLFVAIAVAGLVMGRQAEWRVLYANLADKDGGTVVAQLATLNVPYKYTEGGSAILVPADRVHDVRLKLAAMGLPKGAVGGFETMEASRFGMTQFQERLTFQRGLEGELTRSIMSVASVSNARVHLALPNQNGFFREQQKPSASVLLSLHPGRSLDKQQIAGIVHLVASSVPEMSPSAVSVLDDTGKLLSMPADQSGAPLGADAEQLQYAQQIEQLYAKRIIDILEPLVGKSNVRAQVTAELDFSQTEQTTESHRPNQTPDASAVRSQQIVESGPGALGAQPAGVPGATSNQPGATAAAPVNAPAQTLAAAGTSQGAQGNSKRESITNYEVDKTVRVVRGATGLVKRVNAAVVVNNQTITDEKGKTSVTPLSEAQIEKMTALVREAVGFSKERGDSVNLVNAAFVATKEEVVEVPLWRQPEVQELTRSLAWPLGMVALAAIVFFGAIKPALGNMMKPVAMVPVGAGEFPQLDALESEVPDRPQLLPVSPAQEAAQVSAAELRLEDARKLTRDNPAAVANIVKAWINGENPAV